MAVTPRQSAWKSTICTIAVDADAAESQVGDLPAALGYGQQKRVEREQEAEQCADRSEEQACLFAWAQSLVQELHVLVGRRYGQPPSGEAREL